MVIAKAYSALEVERRNKAIICRFLKPHRVISTCRVNGGIREDVGFVVNHQAQEPKDTERHKSILKLDASSYHVEVCKRLGIPPEKTVLLGTAANMNNAGFSEHSFRDLTVFVIATAGVETNAGRAGDPSQVYEKDGLFEMLEWKGTINTMVFVNQPMSPGAMVRSVKTATEAKTTVLQELLVPSRYSSGLATGTGTDQIAVSSLLTQGKPLTSAGKHSKLGELIALSVREAIKEALSLQNKLTPEERRFLPRLLERFGYNEEKIVSFFRERMDDTTFSLFEKNRLVLLSDPVAISHALSFIHTVDLASWGIVPKPCLVDVLASQGALVASSLSSKYELFERFRTEIASTSASPIEMLLISYIKGVEAKWKSE